MFDIYVGGVQVTSLNMDNVLGNGKVSFDETTNMLTLNNATIDMTETDGYPIESGIGNLTVLLIGNNTLKTYTEKQYGFKYSGTSADASLTFTHEENGFGSLTINDGVVAQGYTVTEQTGWTVTENSVSYDTTFGVQIGSTAFKASALTIETENAKAIFNPLTSTLSLNNFTTTDAITTTMEKLTISLTGANSVGAISYSGQAATATITIQKDVTSEADVNKLLTTSLTGFETVTVVEPLKDISPSASEIVISDVVAFDLWVNGEQVTKENMNAIAKGITFDGKKTLTLNNVDVECTDNPFIKNGLDELIINLLGVNTVDCGEQMFLVKKEDGSDRQATFATDISCAGKLTIKLTKSDAWYSGHNLLKYVNGLAYSASGDGSTLTIAAPSDYYDLVIAEVEVTNMNAANVMAGVSYNAKTNTLILDGATINGNIESSRATLNVYLKGNSTLNGSFTVGGSGDRELIFDSEDNDKLTMNADIPNGFKTVYRNMLRTNPVSEKYVISLPADYGLMVNGTLVTPDNRKNVLNDEGATVKFNGNNKLILNNANLESIKMGNMELPLINGKKTLIIHLDGENKISNTSGKILDFIGTEDKVNYQIHLEIDANIYGSLEFNYTASLPDILSAFTLIKLTHDPKLNLSVNDIIKKLMISTKLSPIVPSSPSTPNEEDEEKSVTVVFADSKASTETLTNTVIDNILYTLNDTHQKNVADDGFVGNELVINSEVSEEDIKNAMKHVPGSDEFQQYFRGITLELPNGDGSFTLKQLYSGNEHPLCVKIGEGEPIVINLTNIPTDYEIRFSCSASTYVYIYLPKITTSAPAMMASRRIGPKSSVAGGLGGITVKSNGMQMSSSPSDSHKLMELSAMAAAISSVADVRGGFTCSDPDITDLPDNMFVKTNTAGAPLRRGAAVETILPEGLPFVDFSNTKITGMEVSRTSGAFNGVPDNVFIYMPAGNTTKDKNVVIGGICDRMELDGSDNAQPFNALENFKAAQATLNRSFDADEKSTICLPYSISKSDAGNMGLFYEFDKIEGDNVSMTSANGDLAANTPYIFKAKAGGVANLQVRVVDVIAGPAGGNEFCGVYEKTRYAGQDNWYCFSDEGQFVKMKGNAYVPPFRAYFVASNTNAPILSILWDGKEEITVTEENTTAVETVKTVADKKTAEGWWTLNGTRLNAQPKKAGLYIRDGKMVVVK